MKKFDSYETFCRELENATGYQVYDERTSSTGVKTPYIVCQRINSVDLFADNKPFIRRDNVAVNLHAFQKNKSVNGEKKKAEKKVESFLNDSGYIFDKDTDWLEEIELYKVTYGVEIWLTE